jgi:hypothetical protein
MTNKDLHILLKNLSENDIQNIGEDINDNPIFAIKLGKNICSFIFGDMHIDNFPEWKNKT